MTLPRPQRRLHSEPPAAPVESTPKREFRPSDRFVFQPQFDITVSELAQIIATVVLAWEYRVYEKQPAHIQRHFKFSEK